MFSTIGLFKGIACPRINECTLANCIFDHQAPNRSPKDSEKSLTNEYDPLSAGDSDQPLPKRRRLNSEDTKIVENGSNHSASELTQPSKVSSNKSSDLIKNQTADQFVQAPARKVVASGLPPAISSGASLQSRPVSITRTVSPPRKKEDRPPTIQRSEKLAPRQVAKAPVPFKSRLSYLELLHKLAKGHDSELEKDQSADKALILSAGELIKLVLDDEEQAASASSADIYKNTMSQCYLRYKNISMEDWKSLVIEKFRSSPVRSLDKGELSLSSGLSPAEEIELLRGLKTAVVGLESHGYVTTPPTNTQIEKAKEATNAAHGFEVCDRCGTRFQVFPGRDSQGRLTTQGACHYHWARIPRTQTAKNARMFGQADSLYPCCNQPPGSEGCTKAGSHVFKVTDPKRLASLLQFERTTEKGQRRLQPVTFDCEMGYTTYGMELIRVTAISWPQNKTLLDVLVRPYGEILDFNTRFSGVSQDQFANAPAYNAETVINESAEAIEAQATPLRKVESPAIARQLLFDLLTPDTPLIGHAIENDLNACRIVHPFIIDTVLLYPHPAGLPARYGLKVLASKYLQRGIQAAGAQGHDSKEDSVATGDLVRVKVAEKWKSMKIQGWKFESARLVAPAKPS